MLKLRIHAFSDDGQIVEAIRTAMNDRMFVRSSLTVDAGGLSGALEKYPEAPDPDLLVIEVDGDPDDVLRRLDALADYVPEETHVILTGRIDSANLYRQFLKRGIRHYLPAPFHADEFIEAVTDEFEDRRTAGRSRTIAVMGAKGGVGSSTVAHNVAKRIEHVYGSDVCLVDLDTCFGTAAMDFNEDPRIGLRETMLKSDGLDEQLVQKYLSKRDEHFALLASKPQLGEPALFDGDALKPTLDTLDRIFDVVVIDVPHEWTGVVRDTVVETDELLIVASPDLVNLRNTQMIHDYVEKRRQRTPARFMFNMADRHKDSELAAKDFREIFSNRDPVVSIPDDHSFRVASRDGQMIAEVGKPKRLVKSFDLVAETVTGRAAAQQKRRGGGVLRKLSRRR